MTVANGCGRVARHGETAQRCATGANMEQKFTNEQFVRAWAASKTQLEVAARLGARQGTISRRAKRLREAGVTLTLLPNERRPVDVAGLNAILAESKAGEEAE